MKQKLTLPLGKLMAIIGLELLTATDLYAATVRSGAIDGADLKAAVRYRHMNGNGNGNPRVYLGTLPLATTGPTNISWGSEKHIKFSYDAATKKLTTIVGMAGMSPAPITVTKEVGDLGELNYLLLNVQAYHPMGHATSVELKHFKLNGEELSSNSFSGTAAGAKWNVTGENLTDGFTLEGHIVLSGMQPGSDHNHIQINVGYADQTGPKIDGIGVNPNPAIINGTTTLRATVSDADTGNNDISNAEYSLNGGAWEPMGAQDGAFDSVSEDVSAELAATQLGANEVCVRGTDTKGNVTTPPTCSTFMVTYQFEGFAAPLNNGLINTAKAGQAIPAKWRLTDANGLPVEDAASFTGFYSYPIDCETGAHSPHDAVEEYAPGNSGLQYKGNGEWQYNWKTPKSYWGTCRAMYVEFNSGAISPVTHFQFK
ncbi:MAG: PxKF domain-containing protein [Methylobacter sp.]|nr:PxKF domain-containing protein [Methylobacter sp.]